MNSGTSIREHQLGGGRAYASRAGLLVPVDEGSTDEEIAAFYEYALNADKVYVEQLDRRIGVLTSADRHELFASHPEYAKLSAREILHRIGDTGLHGTAAIRLAVRRVPTATPVVCSRSRERQPSRRVARGTAASDSPPRLAPRVCEGCGASFAPANPRQRYHDEKCATADRVRRHRDRLAPTAFDLYRDALFMAQRAGVIDAFDALALAVFPSRKILDRLRAA